MLPLELDRSLPSSLATQLATQVRAFITSGSLRRGDAIPSTRHIARRYGVSRGTVVAAFDQLVAEGYLVATPGGKTRVNAQVLAVDEPSARPPRPDTPKMADTALDLRPGASLGAPIADSAWRESWRWAAGESSTAPEPQGLLATRLAVVEHLRLMRAMTVPVEDVFLTGGAREGLLLLLSALQCSDGVRDVALPWPGYPGLQGVIGRVGMAAQQIPVDSEGLIVSEVAPDARCLLVTPNHLYPAGGAMPAARRTELLADARRRGALVIEDDLDSEYRHVGPVLPSLWELAPDLVAHLGTFNRVLSSDVRLGYLIAPPQYHGALLAARRDLGAGASVIAQRAAGRYLEQGGLRRRIIRRRRELLRRQEAVREAFALWPIYLLSGGSAVVVLPDQAEVVVQECRARGVLVEDLAQYWGAVVPDAAGIILDYGSVARPQLVAALGEISAAVQHSSGP